ncbi:MAG: hypothetical protein WB424_00435 [Terracidiphilus sp.]
MAIELPMYLSRRFIPVGATARGSDYTRLVISIAISLNKVVIKLKNCEDAAVAVSPMMQITKTYSTTSWPSSRAINPCNPMMSFMHPDHIGVPQIEHIGQAKEPSQK